MLLAFTQQGFTQQTSTEAAQKRPQGKQGISEMAGLRTDLLFKDLTTSYEFPKSYHPILKDKMYDFESRKLALKEGTTDELHIQQKQEILTLEYDLWLKNQKRMLENAIATWEPISEQFDTYKDTERKDFIAYHFYLTIQEEEMTARILEEMNSLTTSQNLKNIGSDMHNRIAEGLVGSRYIFKTLHESGLDGAKKAIQQTMAEKMLNRLTNRKPLKLQEIDQAIINDAYTAGLEAEKQVSATALEKEIIEKAKIAGLDDQKTKALVDLVIKREVDLRNPRKADYSLVNLVNGRPMGPIQRINFQFAANVQKLITYKEYRTIFGDKFKQKVKDISKDEISVLTTLYEMNDDQKTALYKLIYKYHFHKKVIEVYLMHDRKTKKQRLTAAQYKFGKDYKELLQSFGFDTKDAQPLDNNTFQWN